MKKRKSFQFRLRPTKKQRRILDETLEECLLLYNGLLGQRKFAYEFFGYSLSKIEQQNCIPALKKEITSLCSVHSQVLQNVNDRLDKGFQAFFRRVKNGENPGYPRFRGVHRYNSFCYPQSGFSIEEGNIKLSKIGKIRIVQHRPISGKIKTCTLRKTPSGEWNVSLSCEVETCPLPETDENIAIDMNTEGNFAAFDNGEMIENPKFFKKSEKKLAKAQKKISKLKKGTSARRKAGKACSKIHEKIANRRKNFCHQESRKIINKYQNICIEDLDIKNMVEGSYYAKSITDASWNQFHQYLIYKAEDAGRRIGLVNPAYTTQDCSKCGYREKKPLSQRTHSCNNCGYTTHRDTNAAQNILALGLDGLGKTPRSLRL